MMMSADTIQHVIAYAAQREGHGRRGDLHDLLTWSLESTPSYVSNPSRGTSHPSVIVDYLLIAQE